MLLQQMMTGSQRSRVGPVPGGFCILIRRPVEDVFFEQLEHHMALSFNLPKRLGVVVVSGETTRGDHHDGDEDTAA